jgi:hypothetical protein
MTQLFQVASVIKFIFHIRLIDFHIHYHNSLNYCFGYELNSYPSIEKNIWFLNSVRAILGNLS